MLIRDYGDALEGDLLMQPHATDLRDIYLPGGGPKRLTPRLLWLMIQRLPPDARVWAAYEAAEVLHTADRIRERAAKYTKGDR